MAEPLPDLAAKRPSVCTVTGWTIFFMVLLRIAIGWHFAYEGVYKFMQDDWRATAYLQKSYGPCRPLYVQFINDPDGLERLTREKAGQRLDKRYAVLAQHYGLTDEQRKQVESFIGNNEADQSNDPNDKAYLGALIADPDFGKDPDDYKKLLGKVKATAYLDAIFTAPNFNKQLNDYKKLLDEVHAQEQASGKSPEFNNERLVFNYGKKAQAREALLTRVEVPQKALEKLIIERLLTPEQTTTPDGLGKGAAPKEQSQTWLSDLGNKWGLTLVGICLMLGLFTRFAALCGAGLLCMYYFAMPPWPGLPESPMAEGHYWIVNKNVIEAIALLMIATSGVGRWWGLDAYLRAWCRRRQGCCCAG